MIQNFKVDLNNMEVRKVEEVTMEIKDKVYRSLQVHFDDEECNRLVFKDKIMDNKEKYCRGDIGTLTLSISTDGKITNAKDGHQYIKEDTVITISDWKPKKAGKK